MVYPYDEIEEHFCKQETRLNKIEQEQEGLKTEINKKLDKIWAAIQDGDEKNTKYIFMMVGVFIGSLITTMGIILTITK